MQVIPTGHSKKGVPLSYVMAEHSAEEVKNLLYFKCFQLCIWS